MVPPSSSKHSQKQFLSNIMEGSQAADMHPAQFDDGQWKPTLLLASCGLPEFRHGDAAPSFPS
eukprot:11211833-Lingulodinium_polyedra.AAC.1